MTKSELIAAQTVDLTNCDKEPIHIPGSIQPHGVLLVLKEPQLTILQVSNNTLNFFGIPTCDLINKNLNVLLDNAQIEDIKKTLASYEDLQNVNPLKITVMFQYKTMKFDGIIHRSNGGLILELEPAYSPDSNNRAFISFYHLVKMAVSQIQSASNLQELCQTIVKQVRQINGFDRVMVYQFDPQENGAIVAEDKLESLPSWLGLHYPHTDIPKQARKLYSSNWLRLIADINYQPVEIVPATNPVINAPLDLSFSVLRSVSPIHIEYLRNMGVGASMSISLMKEQKLWGLIACHHQSPRHVSYEVRTACEFLGQVMSVELLSKEEDEEHDYIMERKNIQAKLIEHMYIEKTLIDGIVKEQQSLLDLVSAKGAAVCFGCECTVVGETPQGEELKHLIEWVEKNFNDAVFYTDALPSIYKEAEEFKNVASGILGISISKSQKNYVLWFRPEIIQTVNWAGNPNKAVEVEKNGSLRLSPRKSFELWKEIVKLKSLPWQKCEIDAAVEIRNAIIDIVLRKADELAKLNAALQESEAREREKATQLEKALQELQRTHTQLVQSEKMSSLGQLIAGVAHEINNPVNFIYGNLTHTDNYTSDLLNLLSLYAKHYPQPVAEISEEIEAIDLEFLIEDLPQLLRSMKVGADRIRDLIQSLRNFSRVDESEMKPVDIHEGIESTLLILNNRLKAKSDRPAIQVIKEYGNLPPVECYVGQLNQVFMNVLANGIDALEESKVWSPKSGVNTQPPTPTIRIRTYVLDRDRVAIAIADNGGGMTEEVNKRLFDPFFTTKPRGKGTGIGLAISREIVVEKHKGKLRCISAPGLGAEFIIEIPIKAALSKTK